MTEHLLPSRRSLPADDPIFRLNAEAQRRRAAGEEVLNGSIGTLLDELGNPVFLDSVMALWRDLTPPEVAPYPPIAGEPAFLKALVQHHWPRCAGPGAGCATPGGSGALTLSLHNFLAPGMSVLTATPYWGPYNTLTSEHGMAVASAPFKQGGHPLDLEAWRRTASAVMGRQGRLLVWLNDPCHNPTGMSLGAEDRAGLLDLLRDQAGRGPVVLILDCAYLDYTPDPAHVRMALDTYAAFAEEGTVLVGAALSLSKALTLYGGRGGALVFPWTDDPTLQAALTNGCRGIWSCCARAPMSLFLRLARDGKRQEQLHAEHRHWSDILQSRAIAFDSALRGRGLPGAPWHGGFFVTLRTEAPARVGERLQEKGAYLVPVQEGLRVGLCGLRTQDMERLAELLADAL